MNPMSIVNKCLTKDIYSRNKGISTIQNFANYWDKLSIKERYEHLLSVYDEVAIFSIVPNTKQMFSKVSRLNSRQLPRKVLVELANLYEGM